MVSPSPSHHRLGNKCFILDIHMARDFVSWLEQKNYFEAWISFSGERVQFSYHASVQLLALLVERRFSNCWILVALMKIKSDGRPRKHSSSKFCFLFFRCVNLCLVPVENNYASQRDINFLRIINNVHHKLSNRRIFHKVLFKRLEKMIFFSSGCWLKAPTHCAEFGDFFLKRFRRCLGFCNFSFQETGQMQLFFVPETTLHCGYF